jgi:VanZ family protein
MISLLFFTRQWLRITLSLIYLGGVAFLSLLPPKDLPEIPLFPGADKIVHTSMYLGLALLACWSLHAEVKKGCYYFVIFFSVGWGVIMEIFQYVMHQGRSFEMNDIIGNSIGTFAGIYVYILLARLNKNTDSRGADNYTN